MPIQEAEYYLCVFSCVWSLLESSTYWVHLIPDMAVSFLPWQVLCVKTLLYPNPGISSLRFSCSYNHFHYAVLCCISWLITVGLHGLSHALLLIIVSDRENWGFKIFLLHRLFFFPRHGELLCDGCELLNCKSLDPCGPLILLLWEDYLRIPFKNYNHCCSLTHCVDNSHVICYVIATDYWDLEVIKMIPWSVSIPSGKCDASFTVSFQRFLFGDTT